jgi:hypothetical protein
MGWLHDIYGHTPKVAKYKWTYLPQEQLNAINANIAAFPDIQRLGSMFQQYMLDSYKSAGLDLGKLVRGGEENVSQMISTAGEFLKGQVPQDVQDFVRRSSAFQNMISTGVSGAAMGAANFARNLGLTSLDLIGKGATLAGEAGNAAQRWAGLAAGTIMNPAGMMITPQQLADFQMKNRLYQQATKQLKFNINAQPDPVVKGIHDNAYQLIMAYVSHGMGGAKAAPGQQSMQFSNAPMSAQNEQQFGEAFGPQMESLDLGGSGTSGMTNWGGA